MGFFSSKKEKTISIEENGKPPISKDLLNEKIKVSVCESIPNTNATTFISAIFAEKTFFPTLRNVEEHFTSIREEVQYMLMQQALELGANALLGFKLSFAPYKAQGSGWHVSMVIASADAVVVEIADNPPLMNNKT